MRWPFGPPHMTLKPSRNKTKTTKHEKTNEKEKKKKKQEKQKILKK